MMAASRHTKIQLRFLGVPNALRMFLNAFQCFQMRCAEKRLNAIFIKPGFPKEGHICESRNFPQAE